MGRLKVTKVHNKMKLNKEEAYQIKEIDKLMKSTVDKKNYLIKLLTNAHSHVIRDYVAGIIADLKIKEAIPYLLKAIKSKETVNHRSALIWACTEFDCSKYLSFFVDIVVSDNYHCAMNALNVIENMKGRLDGNQLKVCKEKVREAIDKNNDVDKTEFLNNLNKYLSEI